LVKFYEHPENKESPAPMMQWVKVNGSETNLSQNRFAHDQNNFEFRYLTLNYRMQGRIPYRYRLRAADDWQYTQNLNVNYPALPKGQYTFEVQAQNEDRYWSASSFYRFAVLPAWWEAWWFRTLVLLSIAAITYWWYRTRVRQIEKESAFQQQVTELEKVALQAQMNPHFIFNCLNSIQNFILENDQKSAVAYLARFAKLVRQNLNASVDGQVSLAEEVSLLDNYLALERERFEQGFEYDIQVDEQINPHDFHFPPMLIQPYVENAVLHGLSKLPDKGKIEIRFEKISEKEFLVIVKDNGTGYQDGNFATAKAYKSVGMSVTQKRLKLLNTSEDEIVTIENGQTDQSGTTVKIKIGMKQ
ncbi:MAG: histidine kinase, partial [Bacteroidota bacterium]